MVKTQTLKFLNEIGLSNIQIEIYKYLLDHRFGTINEIKNELGLSYSQVQHNLLILEKNKLINSSSDSKPKLFFKINPRIALNELLNKKYENLAENVQKIDEEIKIDESIQGHCTANVGFYHYTDVNMALKNYYNLIGNAKNSIVMTSIPPKLLKKLEPALYDSFINGVKIIIYFSSLDFEHTTNYLELITDILKRVKVTIIQTEEKTCQYVRFNDSIVNMGNIFIDEFFLNSYLFLEDDLFHFDGFPSPIVVKQTLKIFKIKTIKKKIEIEYPEPIQNVLNIIMEKKSIKTRDLSLNAKIGGGKLRDILNYLIKEGIVQETSKNTGLGRPGIYYSIVE